VTDSRRAGVAEPGVHERVKMGFFLQLRILLWKNLTLKRRSPVRYGHVVAKLTDRQIQIDIL